MHYYTLRIYSYKLSYVYVLLKNTILHKVLHNYIMWCKLAYAYGAVMIYIALFVAHGTLKCIIYYDMNDYYMKG